MQLKSKKSCEVMLEKCAFFGSKPKQIVYVVLKRHCTLTFGVPAPMFSQTLTVGAVFGAGLCSGARPSSLALTD